MERGEIAVIIAAILLMFVVSGTSFALSGDAFGLLQVLMFSAIVIGVPIVVKNATAYVLDSSVTHEIWKVYRFGFRPKEHFKKEQPMGVIIPLVATIASILISFPIMIMTFLTYETRALKYRASRRFGFYSYTSMTDWHNGLIGVFGILSLLLIAFLSYFANFEYLAKMASYYAFWNMLPISKLDGTQILFGSRVVWSVLGIITLIFTAFAIIL